MDDDVLTHLYKNNVPRLGQVGGGRVISPEAAKNLEYLGEGVC